MAAGGITTQEEIDTLLPRARQAIGKLIDDAVELGTVALVVDQPASGAQLLLAVSRDRGVPVAYVTGLQMRRAADLYAGQAKTDPRDAWVLADYARRVNIDRDYSGSIMPPPEAVKKGKVQPLSDEDRRTIVRWIDLGCPIDLDFPSTTHPASLVRSRSAN